MCSDWGNSRLILIVVAEDGEMMLVAMEIAIAEW
jgi:hypothetical protein